MVSTKLLIQPGAGIAPLIEGIESAEEFIHIVIFRFDRGEIEAALTRAVRRGVFVHALVAHTSSGPTGPDSLRKIEMRLLADGVSVARTATDLLRYHDKMMLIDKKLLYLQGYNYTYLDIERSRSFGIVTENKRWVQEAEKLFMADATRQQYNPTCDTFLVSPGNSRHQLMAMLGAAKRQLLIYDGKLSDPDVMRLLALHVRNGIDVRVIGSAGKRAVGVKALPLDIRLHAQAIVMDGEQLFLGSQSLRSLELDARREVGVIVKNRLIARQVAKTFEEDWSRIAGDGKKLEPVPVPRLVEFPVIHSNGVSHSEVTALVVKAAVKEAIKEAVLETLGNSQEPMSLKEPLRDAAREALRELAV